MKHLLLVFYFLSSTRADYDGKNLIFSGQFQIEHPMGVLKAEKATLKNLQLRGEAKQGTEIFLEEGVSIEALRSKTPFTLTARRAICSLPPNTLFSLFQNQELQFYDAVEIRTLEELRVTGDSAIYKAGFLTIHPEFPSSHCRVHRGEDWIDSQEIRFDLIKKELVCEGNVRLFSPSIQDKESFSIADRISFYPREKKLILTAIPPKRVLFWQEGFSLSAPEIHIWRDPSNEKETIEGKGDVHFALDLEEKNIIQQFLSKYL